MSRKAAIHNLGCKVNAYESEAMQELLEKAGYEIVPFEPGADVYVINTCSVTNIADRKSRQMLHKAKKMNPDAIVVAAGCYVQTAPEAVKEDTTADIILGNNRKKDLLEALEEFERTRQEKDRSMKRAEPLSRVIRIAQTREYEQMAIEKTAERVRCFVKVQDGCNQFCTYCIIPYARGRVRSRELSDILSEIEALSRAGYKEVVLTGIHLSSYGVDFPEEKKQDLLSLIKAVHQIPGIWRIRLGSLEPGIITEDFVRQISSLEKLCPHFHLSLQSGCDRTLERMNRRYRAEEYAQKCALLRKYFDRPALTTDVIVGFPGETEEDFEISRKFVADMEFYETHIFQYSRRAGTRAAAMADQVPEQIRKNRSDILLELNGQRSAQYEEQMIGRRLSVLLEETLEIGGRTFFTGHSREYVRVALEADPSLKVNDLVEVVTEKILIPHILEGNNRCILEKSNI